MYARLSAADRGPAVGALKPISICCVLPCIALRASMRHHAAARRWGQAHPALTPLRGRRAIMTAGRQTRRRFDAPLAELLAEAAALRDSTHGRLLSYSRKVFIPLTKLCRDVCHYCTFAQVPRAGKPVYLSPDEVLTIARAGAAAGCTEALFTLGDKPELRYQAARDALKVLGHETTISYLTAMCALVLRETGLLPHANPGVMAREEIAGLREVTASQGIMLESTSERLCRQGGVHYGSPDKHPPVRLETLRLAGELNVPFTTGILIGIGETRDERIDALEAIRDLHATHGHIQEVIVQNFRAKPETKLANSEEPDLDDLLWTIATARLILRSEEHTSELQSPCNLVCRLLLEKKNNYDMTHHVLDHHDRIVAHKPADPRQRHQPKIVTAKATKVHHAERANLRQRTTERPAADH